MQKKNSFPSNFPIFVGGFAFDYELRHIHSMFSHIG